MKKTLLSLFLMSSLGFIASAQSIAIYEGNSTTDISGTTIVVQATPYIYEGYFSAKNLTSTPVDVRIRRVSIVTPPSVVTEQVCCGPLPDPNGTGACYDIAPGTPNWLSPNANIVTLDADTKANMEVHVNPHGSLGVVHNRYYVEDVNGNKLDSVDLKIVNIASVKEVKNNIAFNAYPNPASDNITLTIQGTNGDNSFRLVDVLGKVVVEERMGTSKKLDVTDFKNGVYILSVYSNGSLVQTRRIVVRH